MRSPGRPPAPRRTTWPSSAGTPRRPRHPPGPATSWLGETVIHGTDIRRPLGLSRDFPEQALVQVADFFKGSNLLIGAKKRIDGLRLQATDATWSTGAGAGGIRAAAVPDHGHDRA